MVCAWSSLLSHLVRDSFVWSPQCQQQLWRGNELIFYIKSLPLLCIPSQELFASEMMSLYEPCLGTPLTCWLCSNALIYACLLLLEPTGLNFNQTTFLIFIKSDCSRIHPKSLASVNLHADCVVWKMQPFVYLKPVTLLLVKSVMVLNFHILRSFGKAHGMEKETMTNLSDRRMFQPLKTILRAFKKLGL